MIEVGELHTKSLMVGAALGAGMVAMLGGVPLYWKGYGLEVALNGAQQQLLGTRIQAEARLAYVEAVSEPLTPSAQP